MRAPVAPVVLPMRSRREDTVRRAVSSETAGAEEAGAAGAAPEVAGAFTARSPPEAIRPPDDATTTGDVTVIAHPWLTAVLTIIVAAGWAVISYVAIVRKESRS